MQDIKEKLIDLVNSPSYQYILSNSEVVLDCTIFHRDDYHGIPGYSYDLLPHEMIRWNADKIMKNLLDRDDLSDSFYLFNIELSDGDVFKLQEALQIEDHETKMEALRKCTSRYHWVENIDDDELYLKAVNNLILLRPHTTQVQADFEELIGFSREISEEMQDSTNG